MLNVADHAAAAATGELLQPPPLQPLIDLAERSGAGYANIAGVLTATYPDMWREDLGRDACVRYPNGGETCGHAIHVWPCCPMFLAVKCLEDQRQWYSGSDWSCVSWDSSSCVYLQTAGSMLWPAAACMAPQWTAWAATATTRSAADHLAAPAAENASCIASSQTLNWFRQNFLAGQYQQRGGRRIQTSLPVGRRAEYGSSDMQAWLAAHMTLAVALRMMQQELPAVDNTRAAAALLQRILLQAHSEIMQVSLEC
jgi:hypothetical protein